MPHIQRRAWRTEQPRQPVEPGPLFIALGGAGLMYVAGALPVAWRRGGRVTPVMDGGTTGIQSQTCRLPGGVGMRRFSGGGTSRGEYVAIPELGSAAGNDRTIIVLAANSRAVTAETEIAGLQDGAGFRSIQIFEGDGSNAVLRVKRSISGTPTYETIGGSFALPASGTPYCMAASFRLGRGVLAMNGRLDPVEGTSTAAYGVLGNRLIALRLTSVATGGYAFAAAFATALPDALLEDLTLNPWQLLAPRKVRTYFLAGGTQTISSAGAIASEETFGSTTLALGAVTLSAVGDIASAEAFGSATLLSGAVTISGVGAIASDEAFGTATIVPGAITISAVGDIASAEAFGDAIVTAGGSIIGSAGGIASEEAFGSATLFPGAVSITGAGAIATEEAFGSATVGQFAPSQDITGVGAIASAEAFGSAILLPGVVTISGVGAIASGEAFGAWQILGGTPADVMTVHGPAGKRIPQRRTRTVERSTRDRSGT